MPGDRIRVLWALKGLGPGGAERLLVSFARCADHERFAFQVAYLLAWKDHLVGELAGCGVPATNLSGGHRGEDPRWVPQLRRLAARERIDVVHFHSPLVAMLGRPALRTLPQPPAIVTTDHNVWSSYKLPTRLLNRLTAGLDDATLAVSPEVRDSMPPACRVRTEVLLHGIDVEQVAARRAGQAAARRKLGVADGEVVVVTVANLRADKDYPNLLRAARLLEDGGARFRFVSVGQGWLEEELARRRDELGLQASFRFLGYRADAVGVMAAGDVFCLPSRNEGLPIALLEAMALGLPVVATAVGGLPTVVRDGVEGRLVPPSDPAALAAGLAEARDPGLRASWGQAAARRARDFDIRPAIQRQQALYEELVVRRRAAAEAR
jgi:glycosyltransferase involved in cell wall biosynthesis